MLATNEGNKTNNLLETLQKPLFYKKGRQIIRIVESGYDQKTEIENFPKKISQDKEFDRIVRTELNFNESYWNRENRHYKLMHMKYAEKLIESHKQKVNRMLKVAQNSGLTTTFKSTEKPTK